jgi:hypothetical protein
MINPISDEALELRGVISPSAIGPLAKLHNNLADGKLFTLESTPFLTFPCICHTGALKSFGETMRGHC